MKESRRDTQRERILYHQRHIRKAIAEQDSAKAEYHFNCILLLLPPAGVQERRALQVVGT